MELRRAFESQGFVFVQLFPFAPTDVRWDFVACAIRCLLIRMQLEWVLSQLSCVWFWYCLVAGRAGDAIESARCCFVQHAHRQKARATSNASQVAVNRSDAKVEQASRVN